MIEYECRFYEGVLVYGGHPVGNVDVYEYWIFVYEQIINIAINGAINIVWNSEIA